jgi:beta-glucosidase
MFIFQAGTSDTVMIDQIKAFNVDTTSVDNFEADTAGYVCNTVWFCVDDGGGQPSAVVATASDLKNFNSSSNQALTMSYTSTGWGGIVGRNLSPAQDWSASDGVSFWFKGSSSGNTYTLVLDQGTGKYHATFNDDSSSWKLVALPWEKFTYREGTADGMPLTSVIAYMIIFQAGTSDTVILDKVNTFKTDTTNVDNFEADTAGYVCNTAWFCVDDGGGQPSAVVATASDLKNVNSSSNQALTMSYTSTGWGGIVGRNLSPAQDWSASDGVSFWFKGSSSGNTYTLVLDQGTGKYHATFNDDSSSWKLVALPWERFSYREGTADGMPLTSVVAYMFIFQAGSSDTVILDNLGIFGPAGTYYVDSLTPQTAGVIVPGVKFSASTYSVNEDAGTATITVNLSAATTVATSVDYATSDGTAIAGTDYTATNGTLNFAAGDMSETFTVDITDNVFYNAPTTINLTLSNPSAAVLESVS